jgi:prepilin-type processing-associated H-X9-DG protein
MVLPAVSAAREAARRVQCKNNLKQISTAFITHDTTLGHLPTGGWGWGWQGDPDRGFGAKQPGGWAFNILPYIEQDNLRPRGSADEVTKREQIRRLAEIPISTMHCVSRRSAIAYPFRDKGGGYFNIDLPVVLARTDYAANLGDWAPELFGKGPESLEQGDDPKYEWPALKATGIVYRRSQVGFSAILGGSSNTYMVGEAYLNLDQYTSGFANNDDQGLYVGYDRDTLRTTDPKFPPMRDTRGVDNEIGFGSAHPDSLNMAFCDGSVRHVDYSIAPEVHRAQGNRLD